MKIAVAFSGGVDSTVTALLLMEQNFEVLPIHMLLHDDHEKHVQQAEKAAHELNLSLTVVDFRSYFSDHVITPFLTHYRQGLTPSPCPSCNKIIKSRLLWRHAHECGCERVATGHYAGIEDQGKTLMIRKGIDLSKDQSYFLALLSSEDLKKMMFPLSELTKVEVRDVARRRGLSVYDRSESQELCFVAERDYRSFLRKHNIVDLPGSIVDVSGNKLGSHKGISHYTVGQRRGLGICGERPRYVVEIKPETNTVVVGFREETFGDRLAVKMMNVHDPKILEHNPNLKVKIRSTAREVGCVLQTIDDGIYIFQMEEARSAIAPGQLAAFYLDDVVVAGGWIVKSI